MVTPHTKRTLEVDTMPNAHAHSLYVSGHSDFVGLMTVWTNTAVCPLVMADLFMDLHIHHHAAGVKWVLSQPKRPVFKRDYSSGPYPFSMLRDTPDLYWFCDNMMTFSNCLPSELFRIVGRVATWSPFIGIASISVPSIEMGLLALLDGLALWYTPDEIIDTTLTDTLSQSRLTPDTATGAAR